MCQKILKTKRLHILPFKEEDLDNLYKLHSHPLVSKTTIDGMQSLKQVKNHLQHFMQHQNCHQFSQWAIYENETGNFVGRAGYSKRRLS